MKKGKEIKARVNVETGELKNIESGTVLAHNYPVPKIGDDVTVYIAGKATSWNVVHVSGGKGRISIVPQIVTFQPKEDKKQEETAK